MIIHKTKTDRIDASIIADMILFRSGRLCEKNEVISNINSLIKSLETLEFDMRAAFYSRDCPGK
jgi:transposase